MAESIRARCNDCEEELDIELSDGYAEGHCAYCNEPIEIQFNEAGELEVEYGVLILEDVALRTFLLSAPQEA